MHNEKRDYTEGCITVISKEGVVYQEMISLIKSKGLSTSTIENPVGLYFVKVTPGKEQHWIDELEKDDRVHCAELIINDKKMQ